MKKSICVLLSFGLLFIMAGCGNIAAEGGQESVSEQTEQSVDHNKEGSEAENQEPSESVSEQEQETNMEQKTLVVYFSATGTTEPLAEYAAEILEADIYEIMCYYSQSMSFT